MMPKKWKMYIPAVVFFLVGIGLLVYAFALAPESKVSDEEVARVEKMFSGLEQDGPLLGDPKAKERLVLFVDLQCVFCAKFSKEGLPVLIDEVRLGRLKLDLRTLSILGPDSLFAAEAAQAAALQDKMWQFTELFYLNQEAAGSGYIDENFIRTLYRPLLINEELAEDAQTKSRAKRAVFLDDDLAFKSGVRATPSFLFIDAQGSVSPVVFKSFSKQDITEALKEARS